MITIEEAIKHCEEVAEDQVRLYRLCPSEYDCNGLSDCKTLADGKNKGCLKRADENRQLAEWLKKLNLLIRLIKMGEKESEDLQMDQKKETIEILKDLWKYEHSEYSEKDIRKALDIAIKALQQEFVLDKIRAKIKGWQVDIHDNEYDADKHDFVFERIFEIIDEYKAESEE